MDLKRFRHDLKVSQKELAEVFNCKQGHISNIECGQRSLTTLQIRLLIERFGFDTIAKYSEPGELPQGMVTVNAPVISGNSGPVQSGSGNQMSTSDNALVEVLKQQSEQITKLLEQSSKKDEQIDRLISILEKK